MSGQNRRPSGLWAALALFGLAFALQVALTLGELEFLLSDDKARAVSAGSRAAAPTLFPAIAGYFAAIAALHVLAALACWAAAVASRMACGLQSTTQRPLSIGWSAAVLLLTLLANAYFFPHSLFAPSFREIAHATILSLPVTAAYAALLATACVAALLGAYVRTVRAPLPESRCRFLRAALPVAASLAVAGAVVAPITRTHATSRDDRPNVIIVGIDSLRCDLSGLGDPATLTPHVDRFLRESHRFTDAITPLARTFPSWVAILTGRHPVTTNARVNLTPRRLVHEGDTLPRALGRAGYATVLATDEVRFSNIDRSYGYERLIAPRIGATDFLIGTFSDLPLANLATLVPWSRYLFPDVYANRAAHKIYRPAAFVEYLDAELEPDGRPMFVVAHLTLAHWPYTWSTSEGTEGFGNKQPNYRAAVHEVDRQFGALIDTFRGKGLLHNAIVVVLSDHGEAVALPGDSLLPRGHEDAARRMMSMWGHGTSVLGPHQYRVVLGMRALGNARLPANPTVQSAPVTLEDVAPTLLELTGVQTSDSQEGRSLVPLIKGDHAAAETFRTRFRFTESEFNPPTIQKAVASGRLSDRDVARDSARYYSVEPRTGYVELTEKALAQIIRDKELAVLYDGRKLAAVPANGGRKFFYFDAPGSFPRTATDARLLATDPRAAPLLAALERRFPGEVAAAR